MITFYKYRNRRYYSPDLKTYVNNPVILQFINDNLELRFIDHKTKNDITEECLRRVKAWALCHEQKVGEPNKSLSYISQGVIGKQRGFLDNTKWQDSQMLLPLRMG